MTIPIHPSNRPFVTSPPATGSLARVQTDGDRRSVVSDNDPVDTSCDRRLGFELGYIIISSGRKGSHLGSKIFVRITFVGLKF